MQSRKLHALSLHSAEYTTVSAHQFKGIPAERTLTPREKQQAKGSTAARTCTLVLRASKHSIPGSACTDNARPMNSAHAPLRNELLLIIAARSHTTPVLPEWQHSHVQPIAQGCAAVARARVAEFVKFE